MTVIVTMDQNRRKIKMRNKAKQGKIVLGCDNVSYVILSYMSSVVLVRNKQDFRGKSGPPQGEMSEPLKRKIQARPKEKSELPKKSREVARGEG